MTAPSSFRNNGEHQTKKGRANPSGQRALVGARGWLALAPPRHSWQSDPPSVGRPHVAAVLVRHGAADSIQDAFDRWLAKGRPAYLDKERLTPDEAMRLARASGGVPVLAHPFSLELEPAPLEERVGELAALGLAGIEAVYGRYTQDDRAGLTALARRRDLIATGGSDHHGTYKPDLHVGVGTGDLDVPDTALEALRARRP